MTAKNVHDYLYELTAHMDDETYKPEPEKLGVLASMLMAAAATPELLVSHNELLLMSVDLLILYTGRFPEYINGGDDPLTTDDLYTLKGIIAKYKQ